MDERTPDATSVTAAHGWTDRVHDAYRSIRGPLWRALVAWSGSPDVADEAVAEAFVQLLRRGDEVRDAEAWAWRTAFRVAAGDLQRRRQAGGTGVGGPSRAGDAALRLVPAAVDRLPDDALDLVAALAQLSEQQRRCVALVDVAGHTAPSAAVVLGTSAATVRVQLMRARRRLRTILDAPSTPAGATAAADVDRGRVAPSSAFGRSTGIAGPDEIWAAADRTAGAGNDEQHESEEDER